MDYEKENFNPNQKTISQEIDIWLEILIDHARFMRNGFDPTQERLFEEANQFSEEIVKLQERNHYNTGEDVEYLHEIQDILEDLISFKRRVRRGINNYRILSILPAVLIDHLINEGIFFSGILSRIKGEPRPTWPEIDLPDNRTASTAPQAYIPTLPDEYENIAWEELLFWLEIQYEHADVLSLYFRPQQNQLRRQTLRWSNRLKRLYNNVLSGFQSSRIGPERFIRAALNLMEDWAEFLKNFYQEIKNCSIPGEQINLWPQVIDHMWRETVYFLQVLRILSRLF